MLSGVRFGIYSTPTPKGWKTATTSHARLQPAGTKRIDDICRYVNDVSSLSPADVKAVLECMFQYVALQMENGYNVEIENFGHFSVALRSCTATNDQGRIVRRVAINGVNFRCAPRLKKHLFSEARLQRVQKADPAFPEPEDRKNRLLAYLETHGAISKRGYAELNACSRYLANSDIRSFVEEGLILASGGGTHRVYLPAAAPTP